MVEVHGTLVLTESEPEVDGLQESEYTYPKTFETTDSGFTSPFPIPSRLTTSLLSLFGGTSKRPPSPCTRPLFLDRK